MSSKSLKWNRPGKNAYSVTTDDGTYSVCKVGTAKGMTYEAWRTRAHRDGPHLIAVHLATADEARSACEADARE